ncbi:MAG: aspartate kinase [Alphaproteobacteria bacterium]|nr:aspartate kinase [Alphaproteobacteria bacterium]
MSLIVKKFGGSLLSSTEKIIQIAKKIAKSYNEGNDIVVIVSAMGDETDRLIELAGKISSNPSAREYDVLVSSGEQVSCALLAIALIDLRCSAYSYLGWQIGIKTDGINKNAEILQIDSTLLKTNIAQRKISIIAGFQGIDKDNNITTLGRGGSDATAVVIASSLQADICKIYTDVDGIYSVDPKLISNAKKFSKISYDQMLMLANGGAQVMQPYAVEIAKKYNVHIQVALGSSDGNNGTLISPIAHENNNQLLLGISVSKNNSMFSLELPLANGNVLLKLLDNLKKAQVEISILKNQKNPITRTSKLVFTSSNKNHLHILEHISNQPKYRKLIDFKINKNISMLNFVGIKKEHLTEILNLVKRILVKENIGIYFVKIYNLSIVVIISEDSLKHALHCLSTALAK